MNTHARHDRTIRLLTARLHAIALVANRATPESSGALARNLVEPSLIRAAVATRNAVVLELISVDEAGAIWDAAARGERQLAAERTAKPAAKRQPAQPAYPRAAGPPAEHRPAANPQPAPRDERQLAAQRTAKPAYPRHAA